MNFTIERITEINYPAFADMTYWRKNTAEIKWAMAMKALQNLWKNKNRPLKKIKDLFL